MRILFYDLVRKKQLGTHYIHVFEVLSELCKIGHSIIYANGKSYDQNQIEGISFYSSVNQQRAPWVRVKIFAATSFCWGEAMILWSFLKEIKLFFLALKSSLLRKPDIIYRRHILFVSNYLLAKLLKVPSITEVNGITVDEIKITHRVDKFSLTVINAIEKFNLPKADKIIVVTSKLKEILQHDYKVPKNKIVVIENAANTDLFKPMNSAEAQKALNLDQSYRYVCFMGSLEQYQGVEYLIKSVPLILCKVPKVRYLIVGDGPMKKELTELTEQIGVSDRVIFIGRVPYEQVHLYINASDICVVPKKPMRSGYSPLKLCEYMACGKPVVATRTSGFQILEENNAGLLVNPETSREFANAMIKLLQDSELRKQMGENGRKYVVENRSWESVASKVAEVCEHTIRQNEKQLLSKGRKQ